jgi:hypothetical protein
MRTVRFPLPIGDLLRSLSEVGFFDRSLLIGSWAMVLYQELYGVPYVLRTLDVDFAVHLAHPFDIQTRKTKWPDFSPRQWMSKSSVLLISLKRANMASCARLTSARSSPQRGPRRPRMMISSSPVSTLALSSTIVRWVWTWASSEPAIATDNARAAATHIRDVRIGAVVELRRHDLRARRDRS